MEREGAYNATKAMSSLYGGFFMEVAKEIGREKALALHGKQGEGFGNMLVGMLRQAAERGLDIKTLSSVVSGVPALFGMTPEVEERASSLEVRAHQCPMYDGWKEAGLDHETIGALCRATAAVEYAALARAFPQLSVRLDFKSAPDKPCIEHYSLSE
jgi:hypothetical protein